MTKLRAIITALALVLLLPANVMAISAKDQHAVDFDTVWYDATDGTTACSGAGSITLTGDSNAIKVFNYFVTQGFSQQAAAGIVGNLQAESSVLPQRLQGTPASQITVAESLTPSQLSESIGYGIAQWTPPGKMITAVKNQSKDPNDLGVQAAFLSDGVKGASQLFNDLKAATTPEAAADVFLVDYERPKDPEATRAFREVAARAVFDKGTAGSTLPGPITPPAGLDNTGCASTGGNGDYKNPFRDLKSSQVGRVDGGVDWAGSGGNGPVYAVGGATITRVIYGSRSGWPGFGTDTQGAYITMKMTEGKANGKYIYLAEDCVPTVSVGMSVTADTVICNYTQHNAGLEIGWGDENGAEEYISWSDYPGHNGNSFASTSGLDMSRFLVSISGPPGVNTHDQTTLSPPATWPKW